MQFQQVDECRRSETQDRLIGFIIRHYQDCAPTAYAVPYLHHAFQYRSMNSTASPLGGSFAGAVTALNDYAVVRYTNVAFLTFLVYDHAITFDTEVSRIWTLPLGLPKVLFLINRYVVPPMLIFDGVVPAIYDLPESLCTFIAKWTTWPTIISLGTVELILVIRVLAISGHRKELRTFLAGLFICEMIAWITLSVLILTRTTGFPGGYIYPGCLFSAPTYFYTAWIPPVVFESILILTTLYNMGRYHYQWSKEGARSRYVTSALGILARDSLIYFLFIFSVLLANLFIARFGRDFLGSLLIAPSSVIACVGAARMMMNLRELSTREDDPRTTRTDPNLNELEFRDPQSTSLEAHSFN
ncbi:hypothetical protein C8R44DRAFT_984229 [Mycena epipterygia]|nr:hypothetical protein C8R44DRAFT_984229 [Mycena epipterygia]